MKITSIQQQVKNQSRYSIYIDGKYSFSLSENDLITSGVRLNQQLTGTELKKLQQDSVTGKAYDRVLNYVTIRPRSQHEIEQYMRRKDYDPEVQAIVLERIEKLGLINDLDFAKRWVEWRLGSSNKSKRQIQAELLQKRVGKEIIEQVLNDIDSDFELTQIKRLIEHKGYRYSDPQKLIAFLARRGFSYDLIKQAIEESEQDS